MGRKQRISYVPLETMDTRCGRDGAVHARGNPTAGEFGRARARSSLLLGFRRSWEEIFRNGTCDHAIKELCRVYVSRTVKCEYCGNQRSEKPGHRG